MEMARLGNHRFSKLHVFSLKEAFEQQLELLLRPEGEEREDGEEGKIQVIQNPVG